MNALKLTILTLITFSNVYVFAHPARILPRCNLQVEKLVNGQPSGELLRGRMIDHEIPLADGQEIEVLHTYIFSPSPYFDFYIKNTFAHPTLRIVHKATGIEASPIVIDSRYVAVEMTSPKDQLKAYFSCTNSQ